MKFHDNLDSEIESLTWEIADRDPREYKFGFYHYGDRAASQGGGTAVFMWFPTESDRQEFLVSCLPMMHSSCESESEYVAQQSLLFESLSNPPEDQVPVAYNKAMKGVAQVEWIGTFDELLNSGSAFALKMRSDFRGECDTMPQKSVPIAEEEVEDFIEFTQTAGI
ncbi:hypothetical protein KBY86_05095 [Synechococcus sp. Lug-A]|uniref:hypothetical protein n=1 Tax=Synechococcus sp. Lug-A TaxID=2823740 RepID=UPI0020CD40D3|nr:hypothetical protein [Synechococcus sp. Lug-A]MCP9846268.1 hypothetical protein [Synechococcus sp. Lug-A]